METKGERREAKKTKAKKQDKYISGRSFISAYRNAILKRGRQCSSDQ